MHGSQRVNYGRRKSGRGETVNCCGGKYTEIAPTVWPAPSPTPSDARTPIPPPPSSSHSSANQQICDLSVVMNRGRLQPWLPPQAQMDDSGLLKCFLRHSGWHSQGERRWAMLCFITPFFFLMMFTLPVARPETQSEHLARRHLHNYGDSFFLLSSPHFIFPCQPILKFEPPVCSSSPVTSNCWQDVSNCSTF